MVVPFVYTEEEYKELEEENRNLKNELMEDMKTETKLNEEIKKLKEENKWFNKKIKQAGKYVAATMKENEKLKEEIGKLVMKH